LLEQAVTSKLAENVVHFTRLLRGAGLRLGPASGLEAIAAASSVDVLHREELFWALHSVLVKRPEDFDLYDQAFRLFWRDPTRNQAVLEQLLQHVRVPPAPAISRRLSEAWRQPSPSGKPSAERGEIDAVLTFSADEILRTRDFDQMSADELARARRIVSQMTVALRPVRTRRLTPDPHGDRLDLARTVRDSRKTFGDLAPLRFRSRVLLPPPLVVLCDISGSMGRYSEMMLHFLHALLNARTRVHAFLFATRLTNVTRILRRRDVDEALARVGREVQDWSGGTRLRACLRDFNRTWSRRVLGQGAVVLLVTDGLDRDSEPGLKAEADRLHRSCRRLIWLNPLLRWAGFEPRAQGVRALLPHVDEHRPVHNLDSLEALGRALRGQASV
jgi:uncharacterized protein with von Willebrand factor type A (vWA) domain